MLEFPVLIISTFISALFTIIISSAAQIKTSKRKQAKTNAINTLKMSSKIVATFSFAILSSLLISNFIISN
jgi:hypothetical protein